MPPNTAKRLRRIHGLSLTQSLNFPDQLDPTKSAKTAASPLRFRSRSAFPPRMKVYEWEEFSRIDEVDEDHLEEDGGAASKKRWRWSLKEFVYRSISEGSGRAREKEMERERLVQAAVRAGRDHHPGSKKVADYNSKKLGGRSAAISKEAVAPPRCRAPSASKVQRRDAVSAHERYYWANRAEAAELKKKTSLPYRHGLLGCLGPFQNSRSIDHDALLAASKICI